VLNISQGSSTVGQTAEDILDDRLRQYPGEPVRRDPIGVSVLLGMIFLFAYLIYVVVPYLSVYVVIALVMVFVVSGIIMRIMEMKRSAG